MVGYPKKWSCDFHCSKQRKTPQPNADNTLNEEDSAEPDAHN